jgi:hypothetical protein
MSMAQRRTLEHHEQTSGGFMLDKVILLHIRLATIQLRKDKWEDAMQNMFKARELRGRR